MLQYFIAKASHDLGLSGDVVVLPMRWIDFTKAQGPGMHVLTCMGTSEAMRSDVRAGRESGAEEYKVVTS
jgi:hypothetical protein